MCLCFDGTMGKQSAKAIASMKFDFPLPFGPITAVSLLRGPMRCSPANDLKSLMWTESLNCNRLGRHASRGGEGLASKVSSDLQFAIHGSELVLNFKC